MAYDESLAERVRALLDAKDMSEMKMFGGIAFMSRGHMLVGVSKGDLIVRVGPDRHDEALTRPGARPMDFNGRPMRGMVFVDATGYGADDQLRGWVDMAVNFGASLPAKVAKPSKKRQQG